MPAAAAADKTANDQGGQPLGRCRSLRGDRGRARLPRLTGEGGRRRGANRRSRIAARGLPRGAACHLHARARARDRRRRADGPAHHDRHRPRALARSLRARTHRRPLGPEGLPRPLRVAARRFGAKTAADLSGRAGRLDRPRGGPRPARARAAGRSASRLLAVAITGGGSLFAGVANLLPIRVFRAGGREP
jgi:hypothetical protein